MNINHYKQALDFLFSQLPMFQRIGPAAFKKDLGNTLALCAGLGNPQNKLRTIHIAGTNGKGSVSHFLAAILQASGFKTGLYISPHYKDFRERIKINGTYIPKSKVIDFVQKNKALIEKVQPSFFEMCVAMAFDHFATEAVDIAVIETGLGGRLDSTNVILPDLSIITNISFDHQNMLGDTLPAIAGEKAGIIKSGIPVLIGERQQEVEQVFLNKAREQHSALFWAENLVQVHEKNTNSFQTSVFEVQHDGRIWFPDLMLDASGPFQSLNLRTSLAAVHLLREQTFFKEKISNQAIAAGLSELRERTKFKGRWQILGEKPLILCDSAHNEAGIAALAAELAKMSYRQMHFIFGTVNDKDPAKVLSQLPEKARYYFAKANIPRGLDAVELADKAKKANRHGKSYTSVARALAAARRSAKPDDLIVVAGSIFVVAEVIP